MNALAHAASPYLRQHADDPVDWLPWGEEAFALARERDVPVLVSIGYAACHWCHVMQHESFQDPATAELLNEGYVPVKVDREERPDVDAVYMAALQAMRGQGGWPLTAIADGRGRPFFTGTYFPPQDRHGIPSFRRVLTAVSEAWRDRREAVLEDAARLEAHVREGMAAPAGTAPGASPGVVPPAPGEGQAGDGVADPSADALAALARRYDEAHGGFGDEPKFPPHGVLRWLLMRPEPEAWRMAAGTLRAIARGGIHDPLAGGVSRYSVDRAWRVPHFEKMLYDNVQLLPRWAEAHLRTGDPLFRDAARATAGWLEREMLLPGGAFATALDADSEGEEGAFYAWTGAAFDEAVAQGAAEGDAADEVAFARAAFDVSDVGPFEGRNVLRLARPEAELAAAFGLSAEDAGARLERVRMRLAAVRDRRPRPARDDKVLTGQQGLAVLGLARAGRLLNDISMIGLARGAAAWTLERMVRDGRTYRRALGDRIGIPALLEDHALLGLGLLELHRADGDPRWLPPAAGHADAIEADFADPDGAGFLSAPRDQDDPLPIRPRNLLDAALPADTVVAAELLWRVARLTGDPAREERARAAVAPLAGVARRHPEAVGSALALLESMRAPPREAAVTGPDSAGGDALWRELAVRPLDAWVVQRGPAPAQGTWPLLEGRDLVSGRAAAWLCEAYACRLPMTDPGEVARALGELVADGGVAGDG